LKMTHTAGSQTMVRSRSGREGAGVSFGVKYPAFILVALVGMFVAVIYVGLHIRMTRLEYDVAAALSARELLQEEHKRLDLEMSYLKSQERIEGIARNKLQMSYLKAGQVIILKQEQAGE